MYEQPLPFECVVFILVNIIRSKVLGVYYLIVIKFYNLITLVNYSFRLFN